MFQYLRDLLSGRIHKRMADVESIVSELEADAKATAEAIFALHTEITGLQSSVGSTLTQEQVNRLVAVHDSLTASVAPNGG